MITLTFPWWAALLFLFFAAMAVQLGDRAGRWLYCRTNRWRTERRNRREMTGHDTERLR